MTESWERKYATDDCEIDGVLVKKTESTVAKHRTIIVSVHKDVTDRQIQDLIDGISLLDGVLEAKLSETKKNLM